jgi:hypothetical protein
VEKTGCGAAGGMALNMNTWTTRGETRAVASTAQLIRGGHDES